MNRFYIKSDVSLSGKKILRYGELEKLKIGGKVSQTLKIKSCEYK